MDANGPDNDGDAPMLVAALKHSDGNRIDQALSEITDRLKQQGYRLAGAVRADVTALEENRCNMFLEDLATSTVYPMSQDLGGGSDACRLDDGALDAIAEKVEASLQDGADILILNKFGKQESEGRGLRSPIVSAVERGIPVLVGLSPGRVDSWHAFCGAAGEIFDPYDPALDRWLEATRPVLQDQ